MNFAEGIKRIYVTIVCLVLVASAIALFDDRPREDRYDRTTADALKGGIAAGLGTTRYGVAWQDKSNSEFIKETCSNPFAKYAIEEENPFAKYADTPAAGKWVIEDAPVTQFQENEKQTCINYNHAKTELPKELAYHAAQSVGILALVAIGSIFFWMLMAWIGRGFIAKKTSAGSE